MYKRYSRKLLSEYYQEPYYESESARVVAVAEGFKIHFIEEDDKFYCLEEGQSIEERKIILGELKLIQMKKRS